MIKLKMQGWYLADNSYLQPNDTGAVRWNGNTKKFEVSSDNVYWKEINNTIDAYPIYDASATTEANKEKIYTWALKKIAEEEAEKALRQKYPSFEDAYNNYIFVRELVKDHT